MATYSIGSKTNVSKSSRKKEVGRQKESKKKEFFGCGKSKEYSFCYFSFTGRTPGDGEYEPEKYGEPQIDNVDLDVRGLFTSRTAKACLGDLLNSKCFIEEAEELASYADVLRLDKRKNVTAWEATEELVEELLSSTS